MQGLGIGRDLAVRHAEEQKAGYLPAVAAGEAIAAFALSEPDAGSDVAAIATTARRGRRRLRPRRREDLDLQRRHRRFLRRLRAHRRGAGRAGACRPSSSRPTRRASASPSGIDVIAPHPLATPALRRAAGCRPPACSASAGEGFRIAMATLDVFRTTRRRGRARLRPPRARRGAGARRDARELSARPLADLQITQARLADMAIDDRRRGAARLSRRLDQGRGARARVTREAAMAKLYRHRGGAARGRRRGAALGGDGVRARRAGRARSTARSARCASTRARARCRS